MMPPDYMARLRTSRNIDVKTSIDRLALGVLHDQARTVRLGEKMGKEIPVSSQKRH
jgi:hypothetical protein